MKFAGLNEKAFLRPWISLIVKNILIINKAPAVRRELRKFRLRTTSRRLVCNDVGNNNRLGKSSYRRWPCGALLGRRAENPGKAYVIFPIWFKSPKKRPCEFYRFMEEISGFYPVVGALGEIGTIPKCRDLSPMVLVL